MSRRITSTVAALAVLALASGCTFLNITRDRDPGDDPSGTGEVTVDVLYAAGDTGGVAQQEIAVTESADGELRIDFSEEEVVGFGDMTRAASWNAVTVATLLTGAPLGRSYRFAFDDRIDGPSAGAVTTVAVLSVLLGDRIDPEITMTGTINPTGTVGTVGGIPEKMQGVIDAGEISTVLIPAGQRNATDFEGNQVDVVDLGRSGGVEVREVGTIYEAYEAMTGESIPSPGDVGGPTTTEVGYDKLNAATTQALARFDRAYATFYALDPVIVDAGIDLAGQATATGDRARKLQGQGLQAGAFIEAHQAAIEMEAITNTFETVQDIILRGGAALDARIAVGETALDEFAAHIDTLGTYSPKTLTDVEALVSSYGNAFDALSILQFGSGSLQALSDNLAAGTYTTIDALLVDILIPLLYFEFGRGQLEFSKALFEVGRDGDGGPVAEDADLEAIGSFFRRGADANWAAFEAGVISPNAEGIGVSDDVFRTDLGAVDLSVALAFAAQSGQALLEEYIGPDEPNAAYAAMGYGYLNYARNAVLIEKYYNNGQLDDSLNLVGVSSETILSVALDLGRTQVARSVSVLAANGTQSVIATGAYEQAGVDREGALPEKFDAIAQYSGAFLLSRTMAFVGGYPRDGWQR